MSDKDNGKGKDKNNDEIECDEDGGGTSTAPGTAARTNVLIRVTPLFEQGNQVFCGIEPPTGNKEGGMVKLPRGHNYKLQFELQPGGPSAPQNLVFSPAHPPNQENPNDGSDAFWCDGNDCPTHQVMDARYWDPLLSNGGRTLEVKVDVQPADAAPSAVHYRLNVENGVRSYRFDPIIIHD